MRELSDWLERTWRFGVAAQLVVLVVLEIAAYLLKSSHVGSSLGPGPLASAVAWYAFFTWRVSRGGWISRYLLIVGALGFYFASATSLAKSWNLLTIAAIVVGLLMLAILTSPAMRLRCWRVDAGKLVAARITPRPWILPWGLVAGVVVTLLFLSGQRLGYPMPFLVTSAHGPQVAAGHLIRDWTQWSLIAVSLLYLISRLPRGGEFTEEDQTTLLDVSTLG